MPRQPLDTTSGSASPERVKWDGPNDLDEDMPRPRGLKRRAISDIPGCLKGKEAGWTEVVWKITSTGLRKERYLIVMEHFIAFAHTDGVVSQISCLADLTRVYYTSAAKRIYIETRDHAKGFHWEPHLSHPSNRSRGHASPWGVIEAINDARYAFTTRPLRITRTSAISHSIKSRCIPVSPPMLCPKMDYCIVLLKRQSASTPLGITVCNNIVAGVEAGSPGEHFGIGAHIGKRIIAVNGVEVGEDGIDPAEGRRVSLVLDSTRLAAAEYALELPVVVELERKNLGDSFGLKLKDSLLLYDVSRRCSNAAVLRRLKGLVVTHVDGTPVSSTAQIQTLAGHALSTRFAFDSLNAVTINLPPGTPDFSRAGLTLSPSLELLAVKKNSPAYSQCAPYARGVTHRVLKVNDVVVTSLNELHEALKGYLTFRLYFATIPRGN